MNNSCYVEETTICVAPSCHPDTAHAAEGSIFVTN
jgi:hypothetical protein